MPLVPARIAVIFPDFEEDIVPAINDWTARNDDAFWHRYVRGSFTWSRYFRWWTARRWVMPRDIRKEWNGHLE